MCVIVVTFLLNKKLHFIPEVLAVMVLGVLFACLIKFVIAKFGWNIKEWENIQSFHPDIFFLVLLPPIIFESGYTLQKVSTKGFFVMQTYRFSLRFLDMHI